MNLKFVPFQHSLSETLRTPNCQFQPRAVCAVPFVVLQTTLSFVSFVRVCHHHPQVAVSKTEKVLRNERKATFYRNSMCRERRPFIGIPCIKMRTSRLPSVCVLWQPLGVSAWSEGGYPSGYSTPTPGLLTPNTHPLVTHPTAPPSNGQTQASENIIFPQLRWRAVITRVVLAAH